jgi:competence protein ComFC
MLKNLPLKKTKTLIQALGHVCFPRLCLICSVELNKSQDKLCLFCSSNLLYTHYEKHKQPTPLDQLFWGRVPIYASYALLNFEKDSSTQAILHALKYKNQPQIGVQMGQLLANKIKHISSFKTIDVLIPVPIHKKKQFIRGYNQSEKIAEGIAHILQIPIDLKLLKRTNYNESQTKKDRFIRWENVNQNFEINTHKTYKHIAIVDDVVTTGATLESIAKTILNTFPNIQITIFSLAITK